MKEGSDLRQRQPQRLRIPDLLTPGDINAIVSAVPLRLPPRDEHSLILPMPQDVSGDADRPGGTADQLALRPT